MKKTLKKSKARHLALTKPADPFGPVAKEVIPPANKGDILKAAALAVYQERKAAYNAKVQELESRMKMLTESAKAFFGLCDIAGDFDIGTYWCQRSNAHLPALQVIIPLPPATAHEWKVAHDDFNSMRTPRFEEILQELRKRAADRSAIINGMLADADMKKKLVKLGETLLRQVTQEERDNSIAV